MKKHIPTITQNTLSKRPLPAHESYSRFSDIPYEQRIFAEIAERTMVEKGADRKRAKEQVKHSKALNEELTQKQMPFYCIDCRQDFKEKGAIYVYRYGNERPIAVYKTLHTCGREAIRRATERPDDEYYNLSEMIRLERQTYTDDILSPHYNRFTVLYGRLNDKEREAELNELEDNAWSRFQLEGARHFTPSQLKDLRYQNA